MTEKTVNKIVVVALLLEIISFIYAVYGAHITQLGSMNFFYLLMIASLFSFALGNMPKYVKYAKIVAVIASSLCSSRIH